MPSGKGKTSGSLNGAVVNQPRLALVHDRRVETLLDRRPDRERRGEVVAVDDEVGTVAHADLVDPREEVVAGVAGHDVGESGLDAHPDEGQLAALLPVGEAASCSSPSITPTSLNGRSRVRHRQVHRHVEVVHAGGEGAVEDAAG